MEDLVGSTSCTSADDIGSAAGLLECCCIFADIQPPNVLDGTSTTAVNTLSLTRANDGILDARAGLQDEDGSGFISLRLTLASTGVAIVLEHAAIKAA